MAFTKTKYALGGAFLLATVSGALTWAYNGTDSQREMGERVLIEQGYTAEQAEANYPVIRNVTAGLTATGGFVIGGLMGFGVGRHRSRKQKPEEKESNLDTLDR